MACEPGLYSSIHSSLAEAFVPAQATSLISTARAGTRVGVIVEVGMNVGVGVEVGVGVNVGISVKVGVGVCVSVWVAVSARVSVGVAVSVGVVVPVAELAQTVNGLDRFCGSLGFRSAKSVALLFVS